MLRNTDTSYGWLTIVVHWLTAVTVIGLFAAGVWMVDLDYYSSWYKTAPHWHKSVGLLLAVVTLARLVWRYSHPRPVMDLPALHRRLARVGHMALYLGLLALFTSGFLISTADGRGIDVFNWFTVPALPVAFERQEDIAGVVHEWVAYGLIGLAVVHALAALQHHLLHKNDILIRMLKPLKEEL
ncbi:cytochrome b [Aestuariibacter halophilus]|uniref:Cytochrome b n=1 Tax=Fluctibacter halophilus TaxID=226011 RepID=A0ABS8G6W6_9ALTE|nr:cytochrome b [Aestuariibacter halophilus]MCC2616295.1 cytochrome b [Aestuariibacter halophilus]